MVSYIISATRAGLSSTEISRSSISSESFDVFWSCFRRMINKFCLGGDFNE